MYLRTIPSLPSFLGVVVVGSPPHPRKMEGDSFELRSAEKAPIVRATTSTNAHCHGDSQHTDPLWPWGKVGAAWGAGPDKQPVSSVLCPSILPSAAPWRAQNWAPWRPGPDDRFQAANRMNTCFKKYVKTWAASNHLKNRR